MVSNIIPPAEQFVRLYALNPVEALVHADARRRTRRLIALDDRLDMIVRFGQ